MKAQELLDIGFKEGPVIGKLLAATKQAANLLTAEEIRDTVRDLHHHPGMYIGRETWEEAAQMLYVQLPHPQGVGIVPKQ